MKAMIEQNWKMVKYEELLDNCISFLETMSKDIPGRLQDEMINRVGTRFKIINSNILHAVYKLVTSELVDSVVKVQQSLGLGSARELS